MSYLSRSLLSRSLQSRAISHQYGQVSLVKNISESTHLLCPALGGSRKVHNYTRSMNLGTKNFSPNISTKSASTGSTAMSAKATIVCIHVFYFSLVKQLCNSANVCASWLNHNYICRSCVVLIFSTPPFYNFLSSASRTQKELHSRWIPCC